MNAKRTDNDTESDDLHFEQLLAKLEATVERLEKDDIGMEVALATFEEGINLMRKAQVAIAKAEQKVMVLQESNGDIVLGDQPFVEAPK